MKNVKKSYVKLVNSDERGTDVFKIKLERIELVISYDLDEVDNNIIEEKRFKFMTINELENNKEQTPIFYIELLDDIIMDSECINYPDVYLADVLLYKENSDIKKYRR